MFNILPQNFECLKKRALLPVQNIPVLEQEVDNIQLAQREGDTGLVFHSTLYPQADFGKGLSALERLQRQLAELPELKRLQFIYVFGFDDGHYLRSLLMKMPESSRLLCIEPWPELFYKVCELEAVNDIFSDFRFEILLGRETEHHSKVVALRIVADYNSCINIQRSFAFVCPSVDYISYQKELMKIIVENAKMKAAQKRTADKTVMLYLNNAPKGLRHSDLAHLKAMIKGKPFVAVGLGPSLAYQVEQLKKVQHKVIIAVTDNALREVLDAGIDPDIVFQVEWRIEAMAFYDGLVFRRPAVLCFTQGVPKALLDFWPFDMVGYPSEVLKFPFQSIGYGREWPGPMGTNVGDMTIQFGLSALASEIYLVGMDFSCPTGSYHHPNTAAMREQYGETSRFWSPEKWDWRHVHGEPQRVETMSWEGELVYSHSSFKQSVTVITLLNNSKQAHQKIYSTSLYGAKIDAEYRSLETLNDYPDIDKRLAPSKTVMSKKVVFEVIEDRKKELKRYYRKLDNLKFAAKIFIESSERNNPKVLESSRNEYVKILTDFQNDIALSWLEELVLILDMGMTVRAMKKRMELRDEKDVLFEKAKTYIEYIDEMKKYRTVIENYLNSFEKEFENG